VKKQKSSEYGRFDETMHRLIAIPHSEIKAKLDAEKAVKASKPKRKRKAKNG